MKIVLPRASDRLKANVDCLTSMPSGAVLPALLVWNDGSASLYTLQIMSSPESFGAPEASTGAPSWAGQFKKSKLVVTPRSISQFRKEGASGRNKPSRMGPGTYSCEYSPSATRSPPFATAPSHGPDAKTAVWVDPFGYTSPALPVTRSNATEP